jgi:hypothetical protein
LALIVADADVNNDGSVLTDLDSIAVGKIVGSVGLDLGTIEDGAVGGVEVEEDPFTRPGFDGEVISGDAGVFDRDIVTTNDAADSDL